MGAISGAGHGAAKETPLAPLEVAELKRHPDDCAVAPRLPQIHGRPGGAPETAAQPRIDFSIFVGRRKLLSNAD